MKIRRYELVNGNKMAFVDAVECVFAVRDHLMIRFAGEYNE